MLPFGLSFAPRVFTKILKPVFAQMRKEGFTVLGYVHDSLIMGESYAQCVVATERLSKILIQLGFTLNLQKSLFSPSQQLTFLGYIINSENMTVSPTQRKRDKVIEVIKSLRDKTKHKIRLVASAIGFIVDLCRDGVRSKLLQALEDDKKLEGKVIMVL